MEILKIAAVVLVAVVIINAMPGSEKTISILVAVSVCAVIFLYMIKLIGPTVEALKIIYDGNSLDDFEIIFKCMGVSLITQFVSDVAADSGNKTLANQMSFAGKAAVMALALPLVAQVLEIIGRLIK